MISRETVHRLNMFTYLFEVRPVGGGRLHTNAAEKANRERVREQMVDWCIIADTPRDNGWVTVVTTNGSGEYIMYDNRIGPVTVSGTRPPVGGLGLVGEPQRRMVPTFQDRQNQAAADRQANASQVQGRLARMLGME